MIIVAGSLFVDPANRAAYLDSCIDAIKAARSARGCEAFVLSADPLEPDRVNVYERWTSDAALERFRGEGPDDEAASQIRGADVKRYRISSTEDP